VGSAAKGSLRRYGPGEILVGNGVHPVRDMGLQCGACIDLVTGNADIHCILLHGAGWLPDFSLQGRL
jgi:hypothetical protein